MGDSPHEQSKLLKGLMRKRVLYTHIVSLSTRGLTNHLGLLLNELVRRATILPALPLILLSTYCFL